MSKAPTVVERRRIDRMRQYGCVACAKLGVPNLNELELHHLLDGSRRMGHWYTIFLCRGHHQGHWTWDQTDWISKDMRIAISDGRKLFDPVYGTERELWECVQKRLKLPTLWVTSKVLPRVVA